MQQLYADTSRFMSGRFTTAMFGLLGTYLAMYHTTKPENRKLVAGLLLSAALTSFLTDITEPIEFSFLFIAPVLCVIHAFFDDLAFMMAHILHITTGQAFSSRLTSFLLFSVLQGEVRTDWMHAPMVGIPRFFLYYFAFRHLTNCFNWLTPGRENAAPTESGLSRNERAAAVIAELEGKKNPGGVDCCATRLCVTVKESNKVDEAALEATGARGVIICGNGVQVIYSPHVTIIKNKVEETLS